GLFSSFITCAHPTTLPCPETLSAWLASSFFVLVLVLVLIPVPVLVPIVRRHSGQSTGQHRPGCVWCPPSLRSPAPAAFVTEVECVRPLSTSIRGRSSGPCSPPVAGGCVRDGAVQGRGSSESDTSSVWQLLPRHPPPIVSLGARLLRIHVGADSGVWGRHSMSMEVLNASGRKVSLLNDDHPAYVPDSRSRPNNHSRQSSYSTQMSRDDSGSSHLSSLASPTSSPRNAPHLARFDSNSSQGTLHTPSPMTPTYPFDPLDQHKNNLPSNVYSSYPAHGPYYAPPRPQDVSQLPYYNNIPIRSELLMDDPYPTLGPPLQTQFAYATSDLATPISPPSGLQTPVTATSSTALAATTPTNGTSKIGKKKYFCPHAVRYNCTDTFTTSGHAARHGKKHTGEKNILCPICNKAFTRKDNMKQHERTHKAGNGSGSGEQAAASPVLADPPRRRINPATQSTTAASTPDIGSDMEVDDVDAGFDAENTNRPPRSTIHRSALTEGSEFSNPNGSLSIDTKLAEHSRPNLDRTLSGGSQDGEGESPGLDALAMAASNVSG
ncbi:hypothetical protein MMC26_004137, partial [Xylographa opegraphella]|nr:hypothetical protein [Xylographa opegraphella]